MNHNRTMLSNEIDRLRLKANLHKDAAKSGEPFAFGGHYYAGDASAHLAMARNLDKMADNLERELSKLA